MKRKHLKVLIYLLCVVVFVIYNYINKSDSGFSKWEEGKLHMYAIDVGQADATLFIFPDGENLLIDAGNKEDGKMVAGFISDLGITKLDRVVATHPHEDHIGGMKDIIENFEIEEFYLPEASNTTVYFNDMLDALENENVKLKIAESGMEFKEDGYKIEFLSPEAKEYDDLNLYSVVTKISYKDTSFMVMGDAEKYNETDMIKSYGDEIKANVLRIGHHGSDTSSGKAFLKKVEPDTAIISVGKDNDYGHPHKEVIGRLNELNIPVLRTDIEGSILVISDGNEIKTETESEGDAA